MKLPSRPLDEKIPRNVGNCRKCLAVNATSHANYLGLEARRFPLCFVTALLWGAMWVPSDEQLCNRPPGHDQDDSQSHFLPGLRAFLVKEMSVSEVTLTFILLLVYPWPSLNYRLSSSEGRIPAQVNLASCLGSQPSTATVPGLKGELQEDSGIGQNASCILSWVVQLVKTTPAVQETRFRFLGREVPLEKW